MNGILIFYLGFSNIYSALFDMEGNCIDTCVRTIDIYINEDHVEQDPKQWFNAVTDIIREMSAKHQEVTIGSISLTYAAGTFVCIDKLGNDISSAIMPYDNRARYQAVVCEKIVPGKHRDEPGIPYSYMILPWLMWIKYNRPDIYKNIYMVLTPDAYISYRLCGEYAIDRFSALLLGYSTRINNYNIRLLNKLGLDKSILPIVKKPGESIGIIGGNIKEKLGLKTDVKFMLSSNNFMTLTANNCDTENCLYYDMESSSFYMLDRRPKSCSGVLRITLKEENKYMYGFYGNNELEFIKYISGINLCETDEKNYTPGSRGLIVIPYTYPDVGAGIYGMDYSTKSADIMNAFYESIGYFIKGRIDYLSEHGLSVESINITSPIKDALFYQIISDILNKKVEAINGKSGTLSGAMKLASGICSKETENTSSTHPQEGKLNIYRQYMGLYKGVYSSLNEVYKYKRRLNRKYGK